MYPPWLYLWLARASGELEEYLVDHAAPGDPYQLGEEHPLRVWATHVYVCREKKDRAGERFALLWWYACLCDWLTAWTYNFLEETKDDGEEVDTDRRPVCHTP